MTISELSDEFPCDPRMLQKFERALERAAKYLEKTRSMMPNAEQFRANESIQEFTESTIVNNFTKSTDCEDAND